MFSSALVHTDKCCLGAWLVSAFRDSGGFFITWMFAVDVCSMSSGLDSAFWPVVLPSK